MAAENGGARRYVVLREHANEHGTSYTPVAEVDAISSGKACQLAAAELPAKDLDTGVALIAVPARNWKAGFKWLQAETTRRIRAT